MAQANVNKEYAIEGLAFLLESVFLGQQLLFTFWACCDSKKVGMAVEMNFFVVVMDVMMQTFVT